MHTRVIEVTVLVGVVTYAIYQPYVTQNLSTILEKKLKKVITDKFMMYHDVSFYLQLNMKIGRVNLNNQHKNMSNCRQFT